jgi:MerR family redox-sensitive transcriptional activator SoxR
MSAGTLGAPHDDQAARTVNDARHPGAGGRLASGHRATRPLAAHHLTIGEVSARTGVAASALRFYESEGLVQAERDASGQRRYAREVIRRVSFIRVAQRIGLTLGEIRDVMATLPGGGTPDRHDWERLAASWGPRLDEQIALIVRLKDRLTGCIGCGCLSMESCPLVNPGDQLAAEGPGPRKLLHE